MGRAGAAGVVVDRCEPGAEPTSLLGGFVFSGSAARARRARVASPPRTPFFFTNKTFYSHLRLCLSLSFALPAPRSPLPFPSLSPPPYETLGSAAQNPGAAAAVRRRPMAPAFSFPDAEDFPARRSDAADVAGNVWDLATLPTPPAGGGREIYIYRNTFNLVPRSIGGRGLSSLKFFGNDVEVLPTDSSGELDGLESLQVKVSAPRVSGAPLRRMQALKELELSMVPPRPSSCSILAEVARLRCLTKLTICHFSIRYVPQILLLVPTWRLVAQRFFIIICINATPLSQ